MTDLLQTSARQPPGDAPAPVGGAGCVAPCRHYRRALGLVLALFVGGGLWYLTDRYGGNIDRIGDVFAALDQDSRPAASGPTDTSTATADPITFLLVGSDTRAEVSPGEPPDAWSDAIMIARFAARSGTRTNHLDPPRLVGRNPRPRNDKINAAYAYGGPTLFIQTVEQLTGVHIDHYAAIDFDGLIQVTDDLGGVDVVVQETTSNGPYTFTTA